MLHYFFKIIPFFCFVLISQKLCEKTLDNYSPRTRNLMNILRDVPSKADLLLYLNTLEKVLNFCSINRNEIDMNFQFGLFLVNVNLKYIAKVKFKSLPKNLRQRIGVLLEKNDELQSFFYAMIEGDDDPKDERKKLILTLFFNESLWTDRINDFDAISSKQRLLQSSQDLEETWSSYIKKVDDVDKWVPKPNQSDTCLVSLAGNPIRQFDSLPSCKVSYDCYEILVNGSNFGYALSHRVLLLLLGRLGRGCTFFSPMIDRELTRRFCTMAYGEAEFIANNGYQIVDLLMEQIALCTLDGHSEFLRRSWLQNILRFQSPYGCFGQSLDRVKSTVPKARAYEWKLTRDEELLGGECHGHVTAAAAATLATAVRFLLVIFY